MQKTAVPTPKNGSVQKTINKLFTDEVVYTVFKTNDYSKFKIMAENRIINLLHVRRLIESFTKRYLVTILIVNKNYEVIDGQHRLTAAKELGVPVHYIILPDYGIEEVQILNNHQKNWQKLDYLQSYCAEGVKPYLQFNQFMEDFPELSFQSCERILTLQASAKNNASLNGKRVHSKSFEQGELTIPDLNKSYQLARKIMDFKPFYPGFGKGIFASVMIAVTKNKNYNHKEMMHKLNVAPIKMQDCLNVESYKLLLEDIYNHKRQKENKVSFRYDN